MKAGEETGLLAGDVAADSGDVTADSAGEVAESSEAGHSGDVAADSGSDVKPAASAGAPIWLAVMALLGALLIAGVATVAVNLSRVSGDAARASDRTAAIAAARTAVTDLTTADYKNPGQYVGRLKPLAVGAFLSQFTNSASGFEDLLTQGKVQTTGRVVEVGVQRMGPGTAQLTVLVYETVKNAQTPKGSERAYRMTVSMIQSGSRWLVSDVKTVP